MAAPYRWVDELVRTGWVGILSKAALRILVVLGSFMNGHTAEAFPNRETIQRLSGLSRSALFEGLKELHLAKLIASEIRTRQGKYRPYPVTVYRLLPVPEAPDHTSENTDYKSGKTDGYSEDQSRNPDSAVQKPGLENGETPHPESESEELSGQDLATKEKREGIEISPHFSPQTNGDIPAKLRDLITEAIDGGAILDERFVKHLREAGAHQGWSDEQVTHAMAFAVLYKQERAPVAS